MALRLIDLQHTREFISENDPDYDKDFAKAKENGATVFHIRQLKSYELARLNDKVASFEMDQMATEETKSKSKKKDAQTSQTTKIAMHQVGLEATRLAVIGSDNFFDAGGKPLDLGDALTKGRYGGKSVKMLPDEVMDAFDPDVALEIYQFIEEDQDIKGDDAKKS